MQGTVQAAVALKKSIWGRTRREAMAWMTRPEERCQDCIVEVS